MDSDRWVEEKSRENMMFFYRDKLRIVHLTRTTRHLNGTELQRFREEGWIIQDKKGSFPFNYRVSDEVITMLRLE
jgi:hypothetical protein